MRKGGQAMKSGRNPTRRQKEQIKAAGLNQNNWLVTKNLTHENELYLEHRDTGTKKIIAV
jgi:phage repressor protein C with HTH and peptisase S24 domain